MNSARLLIAILLVYLIQAVFISQSMAQSEGTQLLDDLVEALGGLEKYQQLKDASYTYTYRDMASDKADISTEKYLYEGEFSWADYHEHTKNVSPDKEGPVLQAWNGKEA